MCSNKWAVTLAQMVDEDREWFTNKCVYVLVKETLFNVSESPSAGAGSEPSADPFGSVHVWPESAR